MGKLLFGHEEKLECLQPVKLLGRSGEPLCLAYKTTKTFFGAGVKLSDDGYVLRIVGTDTYYPMPEGPQLTEMQQAGSLPMTLPPYSIGIGDYAMGYSLWWLLALCAVWMWVGAKRKQWRARLDAEAPMSDGPPALQTEHDRFIADTVQPLLHPGEYVLQQAYGFSDPVRVNGELAPGSTAAYVALTSQRLILIRARVGAFKPLLENTGVVQIERRRIVAVTADDELLTFHLAGGGAQLLFVKRSQRHLSNQVRFLRDVPKLLAPSTTDRAA